MKHDAKRRVRARQWGPAAASAAALLAGVTGCGDGDRPSKQPTAGAKTVDATYSIKAYAFKDGKRTLVKFPPVGAAASMPKEDRDALASVMDRAGAAMTTVDGQSYSEPSYGGGDWYFARLAVNACVAEMVEANSWYWGIEVADDPWLYDSDFQFLSKAGLFNCDRVLILDFARSRHMDAESCGILGCSSRREARVVSSIG